MTLVVIASLKDPALFLRDNEALFVRKIRDVVIMGGVVGFIVFAILLPILQLNESFG